MKEKIKNNFFKIKSWLSGFSFRTGVTVLLLCIPVYILSFAQMTFPISVALKSTLWIVFFGLAKTFQYAGITILGAKGLKRLREWWNEKKNRPSF